MSSTDFVLPQNYINKIISYFQQPNIFELLNELKINITNRQTEMIQRIRNDGFTAYHSLSSDIDLALLISQLEDFIMFYDNSISNKRKSTPDLIDLTNDENEEDGCTSKRQSLNPSLSPITNTTTSDLNESLLFSINNILGSNVFTTEPLHFEFENVNINTPKKNEAICSIVKNLKEGIPKPPEIIYKSNSLEPQLQILTGTLFNGHETDCFIIPIQDNLSVDNHFAWDILNNCGSSTSQNLDMIISQNRSLFKEWDKKFKKYPVLQTTGGNYRKIKNIFYVYLNKYDHLSDISEIHFKNTIQSVLTAAVLEYNMESISFPNLGCGQLMYPSYNIAKWFDEVFDEFFLTNMQHSCKSINIFLSYDTDSAIKAFRKYFNDRYNPTIDLLPSSTSEKYKLVTINRNSDEFKIVSDHFGQTMSHANISQILRVENKELELMYKQSKNLIVARNPSNEPNEYYLFHGTSAESVKAICEFGFNRSYCGKNGTAYGKGVYFAKDASYSHGYVLTSTMSTSSTSIMSNLQKNIAQKNFKSLSAKQKKSIKQLASERYEISKSEHTLILARVLVGVYQRGDSSIIDPGKRPDGNQYDSTVDNIEKPTIFVIYRDYRALPHYLIKYKI